MSKSSFTQYCEDIVLPAYVILKPGGYNTIPESYEALQLFDLDNIFTTVYAEQIRALECSIRARECRSLYKLKHNNLVNYLETELNNHNRYFPENKIDNPLRVDHD